MINNDITMLILSCDSFSDLWDGHIKSLNINWPNRDFKTYIVSESNPIGFSGVDVICCGKNLEWSERLLYALTFVKTEYVLLTLDDYFLVKKIDTELFDYYFNFVKEHDLDYFRLYKRPKRIAKNFVKKTNRIYKIDNKQR